MLFSILITTFSGCSNDSDGCETIICQNEGIFVNRACDCPEGYTGSNNSKQITPKQLAWKLIELEQ
tara:strand:- start:317 stop:514 length:198 start_codon:yes stop_codon:yes gene_type:complete